MHIQIIGYSKERYSQMDKVGLVTILQVRNIQQYIINRKFVIYSNRNWLQHIFGRFDPVLI